MQTNGKLTQVGLRSLLANPTIVLTVPARAGLTWLSLTIAGSQLSIADVQARWKSLILGEQAKPLSGLPATFPDSKWAVELPVDKSGQPSGQAADVSPSGLATQPNLKAGSFIKQLDDGTLLTSPLVGATTDSAAAGPRTELRGLDQFNPAKDTASISYSGELLESPPEIGSRTVIGELHGGTTSTANDPSSSEQVVIFFERTSSVGGRIVARVYAQPNDKFFVLDNEYVIGSKINVKMNMSGGSLDVLYSTGEAIPRATSLAKFNMSTFNDASSYFKIGVYTQAKFGGTGQASFLLQNVTTDVENVAPGPNPGHSENLPYAMSVLLTPSVWARATAQSSGSLTRAGLLAILNDPTVNLTVAARDGIAYLAATINESKLSVADLQAQWKSLIMGEQPKSLAELPTTFPDSKWFLDLPVDMSGHPSGHAAYVKPSNLATQTQLNAGSFVKQLSDGTLFTSPLKGATTGPSAGGPRTELHGQENFNPAKDTASMTYSGELLESPPEIGSSTVIGQIHGGIPFASNDNSSIYQLIIRFVRTSATGGQIIAQVNTNPTKRFVLDNNYVLGEKLNVSINLKGGNLDVLYSNGENPLASTGIANFAMKDFNDSSSYFKLGVYTQARFGGTGQASFLLHDVSTKVGNN